MFKVKDNGAEQTTVWQMMSDVMYTSYCQSDSDGVMFASHGQQQFAMTSDLQLNPGDVIQFSVSSRFSVQNVRHFLVVFPD